MRLPAAHRRSELNAEKGTHELKGGRERQYTSPSDKCNKVDGGERSYGRMY